MRIACIGGGPGGLFFAALAKRADPSREIVVFERNRPEDTFGFGVVFSDSTLAEIEVADPRLRRALSELGAHWDRIELRLRGERFWCEGNGMGAIARRLLLQVLQQEAAEAGVLMRFSTPVDPEEVIGGDWDLVVASDGANSRTRELWSSVFEPEAEEASARFIWLGTTYPFESLTFVFERAAGGVFGVHGYPIGGGISTFIVETDRLTWQRAGLDAFDTAAAPGQSDEASRAYLESLFAEQLGGHRLLANNSRWGSFQTRLARRWSDGRRVVLVGDAAHTAHFSVGSGTKMAIEDAMALSAALDEHPGDLPAALAAYEASAVPGVRRIQALARPSLSWWERFGLYHEALEPWQFAYNFFTRSIDDGRLRRRAPGFADQILSHWVALHGALPLATPIRGLGATGRFGWLSEAEKPGETAVLVLPGLELPLRQAPPAGGEAWGAYVEAPAQPGAAAAAAERASELVGRGACLAAVAGGSAHSRRLVAEDLRLRHRVPVVLVEEAASAEQAMTAVLSGRADALVSRVRAEGGARAASEGGESLGSEVVEGAEAH